MIYHFNTLCSTNDEARDTKYQDGDIIWADFQTAGRGQRGHTWQSAAGDNLTFSVVLEPTFLPAAKQFLLLETIALALADFFKEQGVESLVKWTNDIYVGDKKAVGILIEHSLSGSSLARTIVGIGINVNQTEFPTDIPNPVSLSLLTGEKYDLESLLLTFQESLQARYAQLKEGSWEVLERDYNSALYRKDAPHLFAYPDGTCFVGIIRGAKSTGDLIVEHENGEIKEYLFKEIEFVVATN